MKRDQYYFLEVTSELGAGKRGAGMGPAALRMADAESGGALFRKIPHRNLGNRNEALFTDTPFPHARYIDEIVEVNRHTLSEVQDLLERGRFPLIISGDHSNAIGGISAIKDYYPEKRLGVIWVDAHGDLHSPYTTPTGNVHGMPLAAALGDDYLSEAVNEVDENTLAHWGNLLQLGHHRIHPKIAPSDLVLVYIRDLEEQEWRDIEENRIKNYVPARLLHKEMSVCAQECLEYLKSCDLIYVSFDVDSLDPSVSAGTGTSVDNGLELDEAIEFLDVILKDERVCALEITEINPLLDKENKMAQSVLHLLKSVL